MNHGNIEGVEQLKYFDVSQHLKIIIFYFNVET
jgi:hypothetical protein